MSNSDAGDRSDRTVIITQKVELPERTNALEPYLIQISGRETGQVFNLKKQHLKIGRDATCQIQLDDPHISRLHAEIVDIEGRITVRDLGSTNGVFINGKKVKDQVLQDGDKVLIGTRLHFKFCFQDAVEQNYQQSLFRAANIDNLTQLYNKKFFMDVLSKEFSFSRRNKQPLSLMMMDIDYFKKINDTYGHMAGDMILKTVGQFLQKTLRLENIACRYGGEEFAIILRNVNCETSHQIAERLRKNIEAEKIPYMNQIIRMTISIGISTLEDGNFDTIEDLIRSADELLYEAKEKGRNQTITKKAA